MRAPRSGRKSLAPCRRTPAAGLAGALSLRQAGSSASQPPPSPCQTIVKPSPPFVSNFHAFRLRCAPPEIPFKNTSLFSNYTHSLALFSVMRMPSFTSTAALLSLASLSHLAQPATAVQLDVNDPSSSFSAPVCAMSLIIGRQHQVGSKHNSIWNDEVVYWQSNRPNTWLFATALLLVGSWVHVHDGQFRRYCLSLVSVIMTDWLVDGRVLVLHR